jgi:hypothetical protein
MMIFYESCRCKIECIKFNFELHVADTLVRRGGFFASLPPSHCHVLFGKLSALHSAGIMIKPPAFPAECPPPPQCPTATSGLQVTSKRLSNSKENKRLNSPNDQTSFSNIYKQRSIQLYYICYLPLYWQER